MANKCRTWLAALLALVLCACTAQETPVPSAEPTATPAPVPMEFSLPYYTDASLHPITGQSKTNQTLASLVYEGLFSVDNNFAATSVLASSWQELDGGQIWRFALADKTFSDGSPLTATEVVASLELARKSTFYAPRLTDVRSVRADGGEVVITLNAPNHALTALLDIPIVKEGENGEPPLGTGRYAYAGSEGERYLERQPLASDALPNTIPLTAVRGADDLISAFDTKEASLVVADLTGSEALGYSAGYEVWDFPTGDMIYLGFQTGDRSRCADPVLRRAISLALDRETVANVLFSHHARAAVLPVAPESSLYSRRVAETLPYSPGQAEELLAQAGYKLEEGVLTYRRQAVELDLLVNTENSFKLSTAEFFAGELEKLGIAVNVVKLPWQDYVQRLESGEFDLYLAETLLRADFDLEALVGSKGSLNYGGWKEERTDEMLAQIRTAGAGARAAAVSDLYEHLLEQTPIAPICFKSQSVLTQWGQVTGLTPTRSDPFAGDGWRVGRGE